VLFLTCFVCVTADIIARFERKGYKLVGIKVIVPTAVRQWAGRH
jgi:nucleoside diphosphate kinase